ncbi:MAG: 4Fe-4S binding protein [Desulfobacteraceae bacterium]
MVDIQLHEQACRGCGMCADICPTKVFEYDEVKHLALIKHPEDCIACLSCTYICPSGAITQSDFHVVKNFYRDATFCNKMEKFL